MLGSDKKETSGSARHAFRNLGLQVTAVAIVVIPAQRMLNKSNTPGERIYDPIAGITLAFIITISSIAILYHYFKRTDEHDRLSQLWGLAVGCLSMALVQSMWRLLHDSSVLGPVNQPAVWWIGITIGCIVWAWHKLR